MSHPRPIRRPSPRLLIVAALLATPAHADWYGGFDVGSASMSESAAFGQPITGFGGPTVDHDLCGGTATITVGPEPQVRSIDDQSAGYTVFVGARRGALGVEFGMFNVARLAGQASEGPYAVLQPTCNPVPINPITVDAHGRKLETVSFDGYSITPVYSWPIAEGWTLDLRATVAFWEREERSQWQIVVTELEGGAPVQTYVTETAGAEGGGSGVDLWPGLGVGWEFKEGLRLRGIVELQGFGELTATVWSLGLAIDFD